MANYNAIKYDGFSKGSTTLIKTLTASSSATLSFVDGTSDVVLDNTYKEYLFIWNNCHPATNSVYFTFQGNAAGGSGYDETITSTAFRCYHNEAGNDCDLEYYAANDQGQGTGFQRLSDEVGNANDESCSGTLQIFEPSSTTFVKHFMSAMQYSHGGEECINSFASGYFNTTSAIDEIQFKMSSGNVDAGDICLYGIL